MAGSTWPAPGTGPTAERAHLLMIDDQGALRVGRAMATFSPDDDTSLLVAYLRLVRWMRHQRSSARIELRRTDIDTLAAHLGLDASEVVDRLGSLMGATVSQRRALVAMLATGAAVLCLAGGTAAAMSSGGDATPSPTTTAPDRTEITVAPTVTVEPGNTMTIETSADTTVVFAPPTGAPAGGFEPVEPGAPVSSVAPTEPSATGGPTPVVTPTPGVTVAAPAAPEPPTVAVGEPPVPAPPPEVAVGEPPVPAPPAEVAVGEPPVPTPPTVAAG